MPSSGSKDAYICDNDLCFAPNLTCIGVFSSSIECRRKILVKPTSFLSIKAGDERQRNAVELLYVVSCFEEQGQL